MLVGERDGRGESRADRAAPPPRERDEGARRQSGRADRRAGVELKEELGAVRTELLAEIDETNERLGAEEGTLRELAAQPLGRYVKSTSERAIDELRARVSRIEEVLKLGPR